MTPAKVADLLASLRSQPVDGSGWRVTDPPRDGWDAASIVAELRNTLVPAAKLGAAPDLARHLINERAGAPS